ncbi:MAG TPA: GAF domain-containing protein [Polyangiaceae bacterium]|jgi:hypothetical protein
MRWLVDVVTLGKTDAEDTLHVEAESWQKALQAARAQRGESAPMSGFSIELLDEGCRAVDPTSRLRYEVRRAPEPVAPVVRPSAAPPPAPVAAPPIQTAPVAAPAAPASSVETQVVPAPRPEPPPSAEVVAPPASAPRADAPPTVPCQIIFKREHEANEAVRLSYREYVFLVPAGTSEESAETLLHAQLDLVLASLARLPAGKLVNLGVFDVAFRGKPPVPPLATLMWKDWRGAPIVEFPRRRGYTAKASAPPPALTEQPLTPVSHQPFPQAKSIPPPAAVASVPPPEPAGARVPDAAPAIAAKADVAPPSARVADVAPSSAPRPDVASSSARAPESVQTGAPSVEEPHPSSAATVVAAKPETPPAATAERAPPVRDEEPAKPATPRHRARGEDLIADLFDSMHELHFLRDAVEGGNFCLNLALEKIPSQAGIVHLYDINRREFLVTSTRGVAASTLLLRRHTENDVLLSAAMRRRRAVVIADASATDAAALERYAALGGVKSLVIAPVMQSGRFLGAIELLNPLDGQPYSDAEGNALMYIAEQFAEFVASRGVVTDPERISSRAG